MAATLAGAAVLGGAGKAWSANGCESPPACPTQMLVALGVAVFVQAPRGAGTILKLTAEPEYQGLMTAASRWLSAAIGLAVAPSGLSWSDVQWIPTRGARGAKA